MKKLFGIFICASLLFACNDDKKDDGGTDKKGTDSTASGNKDFVIGDDKYADMAKKNLDLLKAGDIDNWVSQFADTVMYRWNGGDSLKGKAAVTDYWKTRRANLIDSLNYSNQVWLPMKVNFPQYPGQLTGNYLLSWYMVWAKYKTGKSMQQRSHVVMHFNADDKVDRLTQYIDMGVIKAAATK